jgi:hypothetical protein
MSQRAPQQQQWTQPCRLRPRHRQNRQQATHRLSLTGLLKVDEVAGGPAPLRQAHSATGNARPCSSLEPSPAAAPASGWRGLGYGDPVGQCLGWPPQRGFGVPWMVPYWQLGGELTSADEKQASVNNDKAIPVLEWFLKVYDAQGGDEGVSEAFGSLGPFDAFAQGKTAMVWAARTPSTRSPFRRCRTWTSGLATGQPRQRTPAVTTWAAGA